MKTSVVTFFRLLLCGAVLAGVSEIRPSFAQAKPKVVASHSVLCDLTQQVARNTIDMTCLIEAGEDPHVYNPKPSDRRAIEDADLILYGGYGFEPSIIKMIEATNSSAPKIALSEVSVTKPVLAEKHDHGGEDHDEHEHDDDHGKAKDHDDHGKDHDEHDDHGKDHDEHDDHDDHGKDHDDHDDKHHKDEAHKEDLEPDPHVWHDPENGMAMVKQIQKQLSAVVPDQADLYRSNADALTVKLKELDSWIRGQINTIPENKRILITQHDALGYYTKAYGLEEDAALRSFSTETRPSAAQIRSLVQLIKAKGVSTVFFESTSNPRLVKTLAREAKVAVSSDPIYADSLGLEETTASTYQGMLMTNTCVIVEGLGGQCNQAEAQALLP
ncbi:metal ABC transporter solute-binding protein, Zn/Mn family [Acaryochloris marina]|uniref:metal ABC transporter solute-binding protein, Zn/Mn family n=1 Tax=Acaryochloris marina TaxID=155978 RepID=UPI0021C37169|nr:zinc ABC transporter substrate-binding protein [Acaryochloris marina]